MWYEGDDGSKIWVYYRPMLDCGSIALTQRSTVKGQPFWNGETYQVLSDLWLTDQTEQAAEEQATLPEFDPTVHLTEDLTFFSRPAMAFLTPCPSICWAGWTLAGGSSTASPPTGPCTSAATRATRASSIRSGVSLPLCAL